MVGAGIGAMILVGRVLSGFNPATFISGASVIDSTALPSTVYNDQGTTAAVPGDNVRMLLDGGQGLAPGAELVSNGGFNTDATGWVTTGGQTVNADGLTLDGSSVYPYARQSISVTPGSWVRVKFDHYHTNINDNVTGHFMSFHSDGGEISGTRINFGNTVRQTFDGILPVPAGTTKINFQTNIHSPDATKSMTIDSVSIREVPGNHADQPSTALQPVLVAQGNGHNALFFDGVDDTLSQTYPSAQTGDLIIFGRTASRLVAGVSVPAGGTLKVIDGATTHGGGSLSALGDIIAWYHAPRTLTAGERQKLMDYYAGRGAGALA